MQKMLVMKQMMLGEAVLVEAEVDRWHALCSIRSVPVRNDFV